MDPYRASRRLLLLALCVWAIAWVLPSGGESFGHSAFGPAKDRNGHAVYRYLSEQVSKATRGKQNPQLKEPDLVGQILLGRGAVRKVK